ncbi:MAG TPA: phage major capsid protein [Sphingomonadales bacterium]|nr:phage major capsid protein [Sphingomonadales bacterium]
MTATSPSRPSPVEIKAAVERLGRAFEEFKTTNSRAARERETRGAVDALLEQKLRRLNGDLSRLQRGLDSLHARAGRPVLSGGRAASPEALEHKAAFYERYIRKGLDSGLSALEMKALNIGTGAEGGFAVPKELDQAIEKLLRDVSPIRRLAHVVEIGNANYRKLISIGGTGSGWASETGARPETATPEFSEIVPPLGELYANPAATQTMLDDAFFNVEEWLAGELAEEFGQKEGAAFVNGDGANKPKGFLTYPTATDGDATRAFGTLQVIETGVDGGFPASNPADILVDLVYSLRPAYRAGAAFVMNTNLVAEIRKFKDNEGNYLWRPGLIENAPATLMGYPVVEAEDMPDKGAGSLSVAFGNFAKGYIVTDRLGTRVLRDPYSNKPYVHFYTTKRVGGGLMNSEAIKLLKFAVSI